MEQKNNLLIDTRTDREKRSAALKARICARFADVRRLLDNPARPRKAIILVAKELGVTETYARQIIKERGLYVPSKKKL